MIQKLCTTKMLPFTKAIFASVALTAIFMPKCQAQPSQDPHWVLVRPFDFSSMSTLSQVQAGWNINQAGYGHGEVVVYNPDNTTLVPNTGVQITTRKQEYQGEHYTSGGITLKCLSPDFGMKFGYVEAYIKQSETYGLWTAFWLWTEKPLCDGVALSPCDNCPGNGQPIPCQPPMVASCDYEEMDIFEMIPGIIEGNPAMAHYGQVHTRFIGTNNYYAPNPSHSDLMTYDINDYTNYHLYGLEWTPSSITYYIDNQPIRTVPNPGFSQNTTIFIEQYLAPYVKTSDLNSSLYYHPESPLYFSTFDIPTGLNQYGFSSINSTPAVMDIAYVNIYRLNHGACPIEETYTKSNMNLSAWNSYVYTVKKEILIGPGSGSVQVGTSKYLRATDSITINGAFTVPVGASLTLDVTDCF